MGSHGSFSGSGFNATPIDDGIVKKMYTVLDWFALNVGRAKDK